MTTLRADQIGPAIASRLEGGALKVALSLKIDRQGTTYKGVDALCLEEQTAQYDPHSGQQVTPHYAAGCRVLLDKLLDLYYLDDQDKAWIAMDKFFLFNRPQWMDFATYNTE